MCNKGALVRLVAVDGTVVVETDPRVVEIQGVEAKMGRTYEGVWYITQASIGAIRCGESAPETEKEGTSAADSR